MRPFVHSALRLSRSILALLSIPLVIFEVAAPASSPANAAERLSSHEAPVDPAESEWRELQTAMATARARMVTGVSDFPGRSSTGAPTEAEKRQIREAKINERREQAAKLREFQEKRSSSIYAAEARQQEAVLLIEAAFMGDDTERSRRETIVDAVRADMTLPASDRCAVAAYAANLEVHRRGLSRAQKLDAHEQVARELIADFPNQPGAYESLFSIAKSRSDESAARVAREIADSPASPQVKTDAAAFLVRFGLLEKRLEDLLKLAPELQRAGARRGRSLVVCSWATWSPMSIRQLQSAISSLAGINSVVVVGVNLDSEGDLVAARDVATSQQLGERHIFDPAGRAGATAKALGLCSAGYIIVIGADGRVATISGHRDLTATLVALGGR